MERLKASLRHFHQSYSYLRRRDVKHLCWLVTMHNHYILHRISLAVELKPLCQTGTKMKSGGHIKLPFDSEKHGDGWIFRDLSEGNCHKISVSQTVKLEFPLLIKNSISHVTLIVNASFWNVCHDSTSEKMSSSPCDLLLGLGVANYHRSKSRNNEV